MVPADQQLARMQSVAEKLGSANLTESVLVRDDVAACCSEDANMTDADQSLSCDGQTKACQQNIREQELHDFVPMTQPEHKQECSYGQEPAAKMQPDIGQASDQPQDMHDPWADSTSEGQMPVTSSSGDLAMSDAAQPVSQVLPNTDMELWDFGNSQKPQTHGPASPSETCHDAAEALKELEEFGRSELSPRCHGQAVATVFLLHCRGSNMTADMTLLLSHAVHVFPAAVCNFCIGTMQCICHFTAASNLHKTSHFN